ncbi:MAG TPA: hypothetical protein VGC91_16680 [Pyrinomonadaceae bacterium]
MIWKVKYESHAIRIEHAGDGWHPRPSCKDFYQPYRNQSRCCKSLREPPTQNVLWKQAGKPTEDSLHPFSHQLLVRAAPAVIAGLGVLLARRRKLNFVGTNILAIPKGLDILSLY